MARLAGLRLTLNLLILAASLLFIMGAIWAVVGGPLANDSVLARLSTPVARAWTAYAQFGSTGKLIALLAAATLLVILLLVFLLTFRWQIEEWAIVVVSGPIYLLVAIVIALVGNLFISMIKLIRLLSFVFSYLR
jgi:hypothetical protein